VSAISDQVKLKRDRIEVSIRSNNLSELKNLKLRVVSQHHEPQSIAATNDNSDKLGGGIAQLDYLSLEVSRSVTSLIQTFFEGICRTYWRYLYRSSSRASASFQ